MASVQMSKQAMLKRVARFQDLKPNRDAFLDSRLPGHERENFRILGRGVSDDPAHTPAIAAPHDFNIGAIRAAPGKGAALHSHVTVEVFIPLSGRWAVYWGDKGENEVELGPWDTISVPPGVMRGFRNVSAEEACLLTVIGGKEPGRVTWSAQVLESARKTGVFLDERGNLAHAAAAKRG